MSTFNLTDYVDGQRINAWDPGEPLITGPGLVTGTQTDTNLDTTGYGYTYIWHHNQDQMIQMQVNWSQYADMHSLQGGRQFNWDPATPSAAEIVYRNLQRYMQVIRVPQGGALAQWHDDTHVTLSNRPPTPFPTTDGQPAGAWGATIPAGGVETFYPGLLLGTLGQLYVEGGSQGVDVKINYLSFAYQYITFYHNIVAANQFLNDHIGFPFESTQIVVTNLSATVACAGFLARLIPYTG